MAAIQHSRFSPVDDYGFERPADFNHQMYEEFMSVYLRILTRRSLRWNRLLNQGIVLKKNSTLKRFVRKGIPSEFRARVWMIVSGAEDLKYNMSPNFYSSLMKEDLNPDIVNTVKLDLPRTYPDNIFFKNFSHYSVQLFNVLVTYAHHNSKVGYCQGLNYIAGLLLIITKDEESTFWLLKVLVEHILEEYYSPTMEGLITDIEVLSELVKLKYPDLHQHISNLGLPWAVITTKWFICLFAEVLPTETVLRIWDCLFFEGSKILFRVCLTLIKLHKDELMACTDFTDLAECFKSMLNDSIALNCHQFVKNMFIAPGSLSNSTISKLRDKAYRELEMKKQAKLSKKLVDNVHTSSDSLAQNGRGR